MPGTPPTVSSLRALRAALVLGAAIAAFSLTVSASGAPPAAPTFTAISAGIGHTCVLTTGGGVKCWGANKFGQIGNGVNRKCNQNLSCTTPVARRPADVVGLGRGVKAIAAGGSHTCALTSQGGVKCWGYNASGQLGNGQKLCSDARSCVRNVSSRPVDVVGLRSGVREITVGDFHTCALMNSGKVKCWGDNNSGQLGDQPSGLPSDHSTPVDVVGLADARTITAGAQMSCAVTTGNVAKCWGTVTHLFTLASGVTSVAIGTDVDTSAVNSADFRDHVCLLTTGGGVKCWGLGQLGAVPDDVAGLTSGVRAIDAGTSYTCVITSVGGVKCFGEKAYSSGRDAAADIAGLTRGVIAVSTGGYQACALPSGGGVKCWVEATKSVVSKPVDVLFSPKPTTKTPSPGSSKRCSAAEGRKMVKKLRLGDPSVADPYGKVLCGAFAGPRSHVMVVLLRGPGNTGFVEWAVFRWAGGTWQFLMKQPAGGSITADGSDIRQTLPIYRPGDSRSRPTGGTKSRIWRWNGKRFVAGPWRSVTRSPGDQSDAYFFSPSRNIECRMYDFGSDRASVDCQTRQPPQTVGMGHSGRILTCDVAACVDPQLTDVPHRAATVLAYGKEVSVGRFRCQSMEIGVRCVVILSGKGFLISREGIKRVGS